MLPVELSRNGKGADRPPNPTNSNLTVGSVSAGALGPLALSAAVAYCRTTRATRRLVARPSRVPLSDTAAVSP